MKRKSKIASIVGAVALAATVAGVGLSTQATASSGDVVYSNCSSDHTVTTDDNGISVICEQWPLYGSSVWMPLIAPDGGAPSKGLWDTCPIPGLLAHTGSTRLICSRHFDGYAWWNY